MFVKTLSCPEKLEWAERHRQNGNKLFARGQIMEAMDVYLTCLVACDTSTNTDKDDEKDDDDDKNKNASTECNKADNDVNDGNGEDTVDIIDLSNSTSHDVIIETSIGRTDDDVVVTMIDGSLVSTNALIHKKHKKKHHHTSDQGTSKSKSIQISNLEKSPIC